MLTYDEVLRRAYSGEVVHLDAHNVVDFFRHGEADTVDRTGIHLQIDTKGDCGWVFYEC